MNMMDIENVSNDSRIISTVINCSIRSNWYSKLEKMAEIYFGSFKKCKNRILDNSRTEYGIRVIFSGEVALDHVFQNPKVHFNQTITFWVMIHSKSQKIAKIASIRVAPGSLFQEPDFSWTCGFRRDLEEGWFFQLSE